MLTAAPGGRDGAAAAEGAERSTLAPDTTVKSSQVKAEAQVMAVFSKVEPEATAAESRVEPAAAAVDGLDTPAERAARWEMDPLVDADVQISFSSERNTAGGESSTAAMAGASGRRSLFQHQSRIICLGVEKRAWTCSPCTPFTCQVHGRRCSNAKVPLPPAFLLQPTRFFRLHQTGGGGLEGVWQGCLTQRNYRMTIGCIEADGSSCCGCGWTLID